MAKKRSNYEGSVFFNKKRNRYESKFSFSDSITGETTRKSFTGKTQTEALNKGKTWLKELEGGLTLDSNVTTLAQWLETWLSEYVRQKGLSPKTVAKYESCLNCYIVPKLGHMLLKHVKPIHFQKTFNELRSNGGKEKKGITPGTIKVTRRYVSMALDRAIKDGLLIKNPVKDTDPIRQVRKEARSLSQEQAGNLLALAKYKGETYYMHYITLLLAIYTGLRLGELFGLAWDCVDLEKNLIYVKRSLITSLKGMGFKEPKSATSVRMVPIPLNVSNELKAYKEWQDNRIDFMGDKWDNNGLVLANSFGKAVDTSNFTTRYFKALLVEAGIDREFKFHELRHTYASFLLDSGADYKVIQELMGHSCIAMTLDTYSHLKSDAKKETVSKLGSLTMNNLLFQGVKQNDIDMIKTALDGGADPNKLDSSGKKALDYAAENGNNEEIVKILLSFVV